MTVPIWIWVYMESSGDNDDGGGCAGDVVAD